MFERFTHDARDVVIRARQHTEALHSPQTSSEHLLLALLDDETGLAGSILTSQLTDVAALRKAAADLNRPSGRLSEADAAALRSVGIDLDAVLARIEQSFGPDALLQDTTRRRRRPAGGRFGPEAKKALELSLREAIRLHQREINTGHLLLGIIRDSGSQASTLLTGAGVQLSDLRAAVESALRRAA